MKTIFLRAARLAVTGLAWAFVCSAAAQDFTLTLQPDTLTLVPGQPASFFISMTPLAGFSTNVALSVGTLPAGVTATFSPNPVKLPGTSILTLTATTNATLGSFALNVTGTGGGITNTTSSSVTVNFGLLPICTGGFTGTVTDAQTGLPVPGAHLIAAYESYSYFASTDTNGTYNIPNVALGDNNVPALYQIFVNNATGYWYSIPYNAYAVCDATNTVDLQIIRQQYGSLSGTVTVQGGGPAAGVRVSVEGGPIVTNVVTDNHGNYQVGGLTLNYTNTPIIYQVSAQPAGDWQAETNTLVMADSNAVANLVLVPVCYSTVTGSVVYADTQLPATNAQVIVFGAHTTNTDAQGNYTVPGVSLGVDNAPLTSEIMASATGYYTSTTNLTVSVCGATVAAPVISLTPVPRNNYGTLSGHVYDVQTGAPLAYASINGGAAVTDTNGAFLYRNILIGTGATTNILFSFYAVVAGYFDGSTNVLLTAGETNMQNLYLLRTGSGGVEGTARDSATALPLTNVPISIFGGGLEVEVHTDANGHYFSGPLPLDSGNLPTGESLSAGIPGYYSIGAQTTITNGMTNVVDLNLIKVCTGASIIGTVVNALTQQPVTNATVYVEGFVAQMTDTNGNFILTNITVGNDNSPIQVTVNASAPGFIAQSHRITIFCNATIDTEFGAPQTEFGVIKGVVTNAVTGAPLAGVFIGSEFGEATTTDTNGLYELTQAPLGANNSSRTWTVTAIPTNFTAQTLSTTVSSNAVSTLNFGFGQPPTHLLVTDTSTPNPVMVGSNLVYTITLTNSGASADNVQLSDQLAPTLTFISANLTNPPGVSFTAPVFSNNVITTSATNLDSNQSLVLVVTVVPTVSGSLTNTVTVASSTPDTDATGASRTAMDLNTATMPAVLDADLGLSLTALPNPVMVGSNLVYTITLTNSGASAANVQLNDQLAPNLTFVNASLTNPPGGSFTTPVFSNGVVTTTATNLASNESLVLVVTVIPTVSGAFTNVTTVTSSTSEIDPTGTNRMAMRINTATAPAVLNADLGLSLTALPNPVVVGNQLTYLFSLTNSGPADAQDVVLDDVLPANTTFISASGSNTLNGAALHWDIGTIANHGNASATLIVTPLVAGLLTNSATLAIGPAGGGATDTNQANNTAIFVTTVINPTTPTNVIVQALGPIIFNPQTGLFEQTVQFQNLSATTATAVRVSILGLAANVMVYNKSGSSTNGMPYVEYDLPVAPAGTVNFLLEYYTNTRQTPVSTNFIAVVVVPASPATPSGTVLQLDQMPTLHNGQLLIEFASTPGATYVIQYSPDMKTWKTAVPPIVAAGTRVEWIDSGPPKTDSAPGSPGQRMYQVLQTGGSPTNSPSTHP